MSRPFRPSAYQLRIMDLLKEGLHAQEIAEKTNQTYHSVKTNIQWIRQAYKCETSAQLMYKLTKEGIVK
jgi:DNA-binding NarL/FixJ family response regulator